ncbi:hypothetical protein LBMAG42_09510 [Deltaproteobacteria bacterium]|nr:hypothetical protein LBMAG42_09510 [Deltaproteobacteria bacterium]
MAPLKNAALALFAVFHLACAVDSIGQEPGVLGARLGDWFWPARWHMFTVVEHRVSRARFEVSIDAKNWIPYPMEKDLPARWESGYRWERPSLWKYPEFAKAWLVEACVWTRARFARLVRERRTKVLGEDTLSQTPIIEYREAIECPR